MHAIDGRDFKKIKHLGALGSSGGASVEPLRRCVRCIIQPLLWAGSARRYMHLLRMCTRTICPRLPASIWAREAVQRLICGRMSCSVSYVVLQR